MIHYRRDHDSTFANPPLTVGEIGHGERNGRAHIERIVSVKPTDGPHEWITGFEMYESWPEAYDAPPLLLHSQRRQSRRRASV